MPKLNYPKTKRDESVEDDYFGTKVKDPYRFLEDPDSAETKAWVQEQNKVTEGYLAKAENKEFIKSKLTKMLDYPKYGTPFKRGDKYYYFKNDGLQNQFVLYQQSSVKDDESKSIVFFNPNDLSKDGTIALGTSSFSKDGKYFAYGLQKSGSDWQTIHVQDVSTKKLDDKLDWVKFSSISWTHDSSGFFYSRYPAPSHSDESQAGKEVDANTFQKVYFHKLGTPQSQDILFAENKDEPMWMFGAQVSDCGKFLITEISKSTAPINLFYVYELTPSFETTTKSLPTPIKVIDEWVGEYEYLTNDGELFYLKSNVDAPKGKVISMNIRSPKESTKLLIAENSTDPLQWVAPVHHDKLAAVYMHDVCEFLKVFSLADGKHLYDLPLPALGTIVSVSAKRDQSELFYKFSSFLYPGTAYHVDFASVKEQAMKPEAHVFRETKIADFDPKEFETEQVFYASKDGTKIPMFIVGPKSTSPRSPTPTWLYGYGGFSIPLSPSFSVIRLAWMKYYGGRFALANLRGGAEYGEEWHEAGTLSRKQNVFDDFIAAAEFLYSNSWSEKSSLWINGGSNGGLLVAACANQRPDLFGAVIGQVGVMDMLRFHKFTIGAAWASDYGRSDASKEQFETLYAYSPVHNVRPPTGGGGYPAILLTTADHDDRVVPLHSFKLAATLQHVLGATNEQPLLIDIDTESGHGGGKPLSKVIDEKVTEFSFVELALGLKVNKE